MKRILSVLLVLALLCCAAGCGSAKTETTQECLAGRYKTAAEWNDGLAFLDGEQKLWLYRNGEASALSEGPCYAPVCADGGMLYCTEVVLEQETPVLHILRFDRKGTCATVPCELDDVFLVDSGIVHGRRDGCYVQYDLSRKTYETKCEIHDAFDPLFTAGGAFYAPMPWEKELVLWRLTGGSFQGTEFPAVLFCSGGWGYGANDEGRIRVRFADGRLEDLPLKEEPLCGADGLVFFYSEGKVWLRKGEGEAEELFTAPVSLQLHSTLPGPQFQLCGNSLFFYTLQPVSLSARPAAVRLSLSAEAVRYYYRYDLTTRTLELMLESGGLSEG